MLHADKNDPRDSESEDESFTFSSNEGSSDEGKASENSSFCDQSDSEETCQSVVSEILEKKGYRVVTLVQLNAKLQQLILYVDDVLELGYEQSRKLLQKYNYDKYELLEQGYTKEDALKIVKDIPSNFGNSDLPMKCYDRQAWVDDYVKKSSSLKWCPRDGCFIAVEAEYAEVGTVKCLCSTEFCFSCDEEPHEPVPCEQLSHWLKNDSHDSLKLIISKSKQCPTCRVRVQNENNNAETERRVMCPNVACLSQFCWQCGLVWVDNHYNCGNYERPIDLEQEKFEIDFTRYSRYHKLFEEQRRNLGLEKSLREQIRSRDCQYLENALEKLLQCLKTLMYSYVLEFYLDKKSNKNIFKQNRADLHDDCVKLLEVFVNLEEDDSVESTMIIHDLCQNATKKRVDLLTSCAKEIENDNWKFDEHKFIEI